MVGIVYSLMRIEFFFAETIIKNFAQLHLLEYSVIKDRAIQYNVDIHKYDYIEKGHLTGLFRFEK